jgi:FkbM family methyltransferase
MPQQVANFMRRSLLRCLAGAGRSLRSTPLARSFLLDRLHSELSLWLHSAPEVDVGPFRVRLDPRDRVIAKRLVLYGEFEKEEIERLCSLTRPGDCVLDIGANIGLYSLYLSRAVTETGRVIAVEPDPDNVELLTQNLRTNGCDNVTLLACAFSVDSGSGQLFQNEANRGSLSLAKVSTAHRTGIAVPIRRGEEALAELDVRPRIVKMDVEGAEPLVFAGLGYQPQVLLFEFVPQLIRAHGRDPEEFLASLTGQGYRFETLQPTPEGQRWRASDSQRVADHNQGGSCSVLAIFD